ncbi:hypothetical protein RRG08_011617 [Elysia crispata]|uniref:Uncharacterized protein n=1 Tax=Elysia crispata TaxID=231223 RepID=A0AAE1CJM7_9GAST|nr:hypothetical protein RRG08_011617 [Elysia crispata]
MKQINRCGERAGVISCRNTTGTGVIASSGARRRGRVSAVFVRQYRVITWLCHDIHLVFIVIESETGRETARNPCADIRLLFSTVSRESVVPRGVMQRAVFAGIYPSQMSRSEETVLISGECQLNLGYPGQEFTAERSPCPVRATPRP